MGRRRKPAPLANQDRWLVSYADFITLLFAFFVVMFATAEADRGKASRVSESVRRALEDGQVTARIQGILGGTRDDRGKGNAMMRGPGGAVRAERGSSPAQAPGLAQSFETLRQGLKMEIEREQLKVALEQRGLVISLREAAFFASGDDTVYPGAHPVIGRIADTIRPLPNVVRLEGHTDSFPIHNSRFRNNWELSAARGIAMLELLESKFGVPSWRMAVAGYAETMPVESNDSAPGRLHNRRVDIVILTEAGAAAEPRQDFRH